MRENRVGNSWHWGGKDQSAFHGQVLARPGRIVAMDPGDAQSARSVLQVAYSVAAVAGPKYALYADPWRARQISARSSDSLLDGFEACTLVSPARTAKQSNVDEHERECCCKTPQTSAFTVMVCLVHPESKSHRVE